MLVSNAEIGRLCSRFTRVLVQGFLNLNKSAGFTSHDCVACVRRLLRLKQVGHGGTLDPAAVGVLPIAVGRATRLLQYLSHEKAYRARIRFGLTTTTDDLEGEVLTQTPASNLTLEQVQQQLPQFEGTIQQIPPSFSAIQVGGKRLYDLARAGEPVEAPVRTVEVSRIERLDWQPGAFPELEIAITCGPGTYIRSIARDLGAALGVGATLAALTRTASSGFFLKESLTLAAITEQLETGSFKLTPPTAALHHLPCINLPDLQVKRWRQGQKIDWTDIDWTDLEPSSPEPSTPETATFYRVQQGELFWGIGQAVGSELGVRLSPKLVWEQAQDHDS